jgi:hypothetical protein
MHHDDRGIEANASGVSVDSLRRAKFLLVDEISMVSCQLLAKIDGNAKSVKSDFDHDFGGLHVIFLGDFFQVWAPTYT